MDLFSVLLVLDNTICIKHIIITFIITLIIIIITIIIIMIIMIMIMIIIIIIIIIITIFIIIVTISFIIITEFITTRRFYVYPSWLQHLMPRPTVLCLSPPPTHTHTTTNNELESQTSHWTDGLRHVILNWEVTHQSWVVR